MEWVAAQVDESLKLAMDGAELESGRREAVIDVYDVFQRYTLGVTFLLIYNH